MSSGAARAGYAGGTAVAAGTRPHVVISTKFEEPWYSISLKVKEGLERAGCSVYNPNTDNAELCKQMQIEQKTNDRWLLTFNENLAKVMATQGFVIQIQQGVEREKSFMQEAEEMMASWLKVPRIGLYAFEKIAFQPDRFQIAKEKAQEQWAKKEISPEVVMCNEIYEPLVEGQKLPVNERGTITGKARCVYPTGQVYEGDFVRNKMEGRGRVTLPDGETYEGEFHQGQRHGTGRTTWPNGDTHEGEYAHGKRHGPGIYRWADGRVGAVVFDQDKFKGTWVRRTAAGTFQKFLVGKMVKEVSETEAKKIIQEHRLHAPW